MAVKGKPIYTTTRKAYKAVKKWKLAKTTDTERKIRTKICD